MVYVPFVQVWVPRWLTHDCLVCTSQWFRVYSWELFESYGWCVPSDHDGLPPNSLCTLFSSVTSVGATSYNVLFTFLCIHSGTSNRHSSSFILVKECHAQSFLVLCTSPYPPRYGYYAITEGLCNSSNAKGRGWLTRQGPSYQETGTALHYLLESLFYCSLLL